MYNRRLKNRIKTPKTLLLSHLPYMIFCISYPFYLEMVLKIANKTSFSFRIFVYISLFSVSTGFLIFLVSALFKSKKGRYITSVTITSLITLIFAIQYFCYRTFGFYMGINVITNMADDVAGDFADLTARIVWHGLPVLLLLLIPIGLLLIWGKYFISALPMGKYTKIISVSGLIVFFLGASVLVNISSSGLVTDKQYYTSQFNITESTTRFGLLCSNRLDLYYSIFGIPKESLKDTSKIGNIIIDRNPNTTDTGNGTDTTDTDEPNPEPEPEYGYNVIDIDFEALKRSAKDETVLEMHKYISSLTPSKQNKYTGMLKGKNLIFITAESFSPYFISKDLTPTLYMMMNSGIVFKNYYQPAWGVSTSDGEYSSLLGLVPKGGINSMKASASNNLYMTLGNQLRRMGYHTCAYHNNTYTYYSRHLTHPNLGYTNYIGMGNGLEKEVKQTWPESDLQMMKATLDDYMDKQPFHTYYMSVSGHPLYSFSGNYIAYQNRNAVANLNYSDPVKAYIACNLEFEYAMKYLVDTLNDAGIADDTVIVIAPDHYPYGLDKGFEGNTKDYFSELVGHPLETNFEMYKNSLIIWNPSITQPIIVEDPCYSLDILPTLSNLFGIEYDSRLLVGRDIFSDYKPLVIFRNYSWISDKGSYNAKTNIFTANPGVTVDEAYIKNISSVVREKVILSANILDYNYYNILFGK